MASGQWLPVPSLKVRLEPEETQHRAGHQTEARGNLGERQICDGNPDHGSSDRIWHQQNPWNLAIEAQSPGERRSHDYELTTAEATADRIGSP